MERCLKVTEIIHLICEHARGLNEGPRKTLLAMALTCHQFLEPALDNLWHTIEDFRPLMCVLPPHMILQDITAQYCDTFFQWRRIFRVKDFTLILAPEDLQRYLTYYAHRIRYFRIVYAEIEATFSPGAWQALHLATQWKIGALAPRLIGFSLHTEVRHLNNVSESVAETRLRLLCAAESLPYMGLFCGLDTVFVDLVYETERRAHLTGIQFLLEGLSEKLRTLRLQDTSYSHMRPTDPRLSFIPNLIARHRWQDLNTLRMQSMTTTALQHISTLPRLAFLEIADLNGPPMHLTSPDAMTTPLEANVNAFPSLQSIMINSRGLPRLTEFLKCVLRPQVNRVRSILCRVTSDPSTPTAISEFFDTLRERCGSCLENLDIEDQVDFPEQMDIPAVGGIDISWLYDYKMEHLHICLAHDVCLTPKDITSITKSWPNIRFLQIDVSHPNSRIPRLDHSHLLSLLYGCPLLQTLGLRFDATRIEVGSGDEFLWNENAPTLAELRVGDSPIYSPSTVGLFLRKHCTNLRKGSLYYADSQDVRGHMTPQYMYCERWAQVDEHYLSS